MPTTVVNVVTGPTGATGVYIGNVLVHTSEQGVPAGAYLPSARVRLTEDHTHYTSNTLTRKSKVLTHFHAYKDLVPAN
jgi:hypothetical protein